MASARRPLPTGPRLRPPSAVADFRRLYSPSGGSGEQNYQNPAEEEFSRANAQIREKTAPEELEEQKEKSPPSSIFAFRPTVPKLLPLSNGSINSIETSLPATARNDGFLLSLKKSSTSAFSIKGTSADAVIQETVRNDTVLKSLLHQQQLMSDKLLVAAEKGNRKVVESLLDLGVAPDGPRGLDSYTALHHACRRGHLATAQVLLEAGASPKALTKNHDTPLHLSAYGGHLNLIELLLDYGASCNEVNEYGETALFYAAREKQVAVVRLLLQRGIDSSIRSSLGDTAMDECNDERTRAAFEFAEDAQCNNGVLSLSQRLTHHIFKHLDARSLSRASCVCTKWHRAAESQVLWEHLGIKRWELALRSTTGFCAAPLNFINFGAVSLANRPKTAVSARSQASPLQGRGAAIGVSVSMQRDSSGDNQSHKSNNRPSSAVDISSAMRTIIVRRRQHHQ